MLRHDRLGVVGTSTHDHHAKRAIMVRGCEECAQMGHRLLFTPRPDGREPKGAKDGRGVKVVSEAPSIAPGTRSGTV